MYGNSQKHNMMVSVQTIIVSIVMLIGITIILYAFVGGNRVVLYGGLCITATGVSLAVLQFILRRNTIIGRRRARDLFNVAAQRKGAQRHDPSGAGSAPLR
jgi:hypothetical protein